MIKVNNLSADLAADQTAGAPQVSINFPWYAWLIAGLFGVSGAAYTSRNYWSSWARRRTIRQLSDRESRHQTSRDLHDFNLADPADLEIYFTQQVCREGTSAACDYARAERHIAAALLYARDKSPKQLKQMADHLAWNVSTSGGK